jgi:hypothetical protein
MRPCPEFYGNDARPNTAIVRPLNGLKTLMGSGCDCFRCGEEHDYPWLKEDRRAFALDRAGVTRLELKADARLPEPIEVAAYYVASEALANAAKHAQASQIEFSLASSNGNLVLSIRDDGVGGAYPGRGSGLVGLRDRVEALGGTIKIDSSAGSGTSVVATLPIATEPDQEIENFIGPP